MALEGFRSSRQTDTETGCSDSDPSAFQACRQAYFLKQQNQILKSQKTQTIPSESKTQQQTNDELLTRLETMEKQISAITTQEALEGKTQSNEVGVSLLPFIFVLIAAVLATAMFTFYMTKRLK